MSMTPEQIAVIDAAKTMADAWKDNVPEDLCAEEAALIAAIRALEPPPAPLLPEEPPLGAVRRDRGRDYWRRTREGWKPMLTASASSVGKIVRTWEELNSKHGPVVGVAATTETVPVALAREAAEALREFALRDCRCMDGFDQCENADHVAARALLARLDAATGGAA